jgi:hypothetical protein
MAHDERIPIIEVRVDESAAQSNLIEGLAALIVDRARKAVQTRAAPAEPTRPHPTKKDKKGRKRRRPPRGRAAGQS